MSAPDAVGRPADGSASALAALRRPEAARIVAAERFEPGGRLVFVDERGVRVADLTDPPTAATIDATPVWSPDGRWIAFASSRGRDEPTHTSIWIVAVDRSAPPARLTDHAGVDLSPTFAPDGRTLAFASTRGGAGFDLWVLSLAPAPPGGTPRPGRLRRLTTGPGEEHAPAWSHRGDRIVYTHVAEGRARLRVVAPDGSSDVALTDGPADAMPVFSPDDRLVAFVAPAPGREDTDLWTVPAAGGERRHVVDDGLGDEKTPGFSADGRFLFASSLVRGGAGRAFFSSLVFVDLRAPGGGLRALQDPVPAPRIGVALAPVALDADALASAPPYGDALRRALQPATSAP